MNLVRSFISVFLVALVFAAVAGWFWAGGQPTEKLIGSRVALVLCAISCLGCFALLWREKPDRGELSIRSSMQQEEPSHANQ